MEESTDRIALAIKVVFDAETVFVSGWVPAGADAAGVQEFLPSRMESEVFDVSNGAVGIYN